MGVVPVALVLFAACSGGDDSAASDDAGISDATSSVGDSGAPSDGSVIDSDAPPVHAASSISFDDQDLTQNNVDGVVHIGKASDESDIDTYDLYWGKIGGGELSPIATLKKTGSDLTYNLKGAVPLAPVLAQSLTVFTSNAHGEMAAGVNVAPFDAYAQYESPLATSLNSAAITIDPINQKLIILGGSTQDAFILVRCNLDGTSCASTSVDIGNTTSDASNALVDQVNKKLIVVANETGDSAGHPYIYRCNLDGTACTMTSFGAAECADGCEGAKLSAVLDTARGKIVISWGGRLTECALDATGCIDSQLELANDGGAAGTSLPIAYDPTHQKLVGINITALKASVERCDTDGTNCVVGASFGQAYGYTPNAIAYDAVDDKIVIGGSYCGSFYCVPSLIMCTGDGTTCEAPALPTLTPDATMGSFSDGVVVVDTAVQKAVLISPDPSNSMKLSAYRCTLDLSVDGGECTDDDVSASQTSSASSSPHAVITSQGRVWVATTPDGLFSF